MSLAGDCRRCASPLAAEDLRCAVCGFAVPIEAAGKGGNGPRAHVVRCEECHAAVSYNVAAKAPTCAFCGAVAKVEEIVDPIEQAEVAFAFDVPPEGARAAFKTWLGSLGWFRPSDLARAAKVDALLPIWWPAWVFDAEALVSWAADSDAGSGRSQWAPHSGQTELVFDDVVVPASRGLSTEECFQLLPATRFDAAGCDPQAGPPGATVERFEAQRSAARRQIISALESVAAQRLERGVIPGSRFRNVQLVTLIRGLRTRRVAIPAYVFAYRYRGQVYRAIVHGQNARCTFGDAPLSWAKVLLTASLILAAIAALLFAVTM